MTIRRNEILVWLGATAELIQANKDYLNELDAAIGDADHGTNMDRGFKAVIPRLPGLQEQDIGTILKTVGMTLVSTVGGAAGPLYGTFFLRMGAAAESKLEITGKELITILDAGVNGVMERGRAKPGDKTMVDAMLPALDVVRDKVAVGSDVLSALRVAAAAAETGMKSTIGMKALKGRASYLGERSIGHQDPGATSVYLIFKAIICCQGSLNGC